MPAIIIDKKDINRHLDLKDELRLLADRVEEWDGSIMYTTTPQKLSNFIAKLNTRHIAFQLKH